MSGIRPTGAILLLLVLLVGALLILPDLLRGSQETPIDPVRIKQPAAGGHDRGERMQRHPDREGKPQQPATDTGRAATEEPTTVPETPSAPSSLTAPSPSAGSGTEDGGNGGADDDGDGGGSGHGTQPGPSEPAPPPAPAPSPPPPPVPVEDDDDGDDAGGDDSVSEDRED